MSSKSAEADRSDEPIPAPAPDREPRPSLTELVIDNLPAWAVVAAAISLLYLVWATLEVLDKYTGLIPKVGP